MSYGDFVITCAYYWGLFLIAFVVYVLLYEDRFKNDRYKSPGLYYLIKRLVAVPTVNKHKRRLKKAQLVTGDDVLEQPRKLVDTSKTNTQLVFGADDSGNSVFVKLTLHKHRLAEVVLCLSIGDRIYTFPNEEKLALHSTPGRVWQAGGLALSVLEPLRRVRITFNGLLRLNSTDKVEHVKFGFLWNCAGEAFHYPQDVPTPLLADALARETWRNGEWIKLLGDEKGYEQYGVLRGSVTYASSSSLLYLHGFRKRYWGKGEHLTQHRDLTFVAIAEDGLAFNVGVKSYIKGCAQFKYGSVLDDAQVLPVHGHDISLKRVGEVPSKAVFRFKAKKSYKCVATLQVNKAVVARGFGVVSVIPCKYVINAQQAKGFAYFWHKSNVTPMDLPDILLTEPIVKVEPRTYVSSLSERASELASVSGEKGKHLALASSMTSSKFTVPEGFVVLTTAFAAHVESNAALKEALSALAHSGKSVADTCQRIVDLLLSEPVEQDVGSAIMTELRRTSGGEQCAWVVRSSEHNFSLNCAESDVVQAVASCWSSLFAYESVQHRLGHGSTAVVVQKMVPSESSGVLYSCHPASGDPSQIVIDSYGAVLRKSWDGSVAVLPGAVASTGLVKKQILTLGEAAVELENAFGFCCNIAWCFNNDALHVMQVQPVSGIHKWTDDEFLHEFDTPVMSAKHVQTSASVQELAPGALTPLSSSIVQNFLSDNFYQAFGAKLIGVREHRLVLNLTRSVLAKAPRFSLWNTMKAAYHCYNKPDGIEPETSTPKSIEAALDDLKKVGRQHARAMRNIASQALLLSPAAFPHLLPFSSNFKVIHALQGVADVIRTSGKLEEFSRNGDLTCCPESEKLLEEFYKRYGKRGVREFEFNTELWETEAVEQLRFQCKLKGGTTPSTKDIKLGYFKRKLVAFSLQACKESLMQRLRLQEDVLDAFDVVRVMLKDLAERMIEQGLMGDPDLIYYYTWYELKRLVDDRDGSSTWRAVQRRKLYRSWDGARRARGSIKGVFVGDGGCVTGRACVVKNASELKQLVSGDVLITSSVNLNWEPYFSVIGGLVTETSAVFCCGATAAVKERGIPCLVGAEDATLLIKTGDIVMVSQERGTLELLS